MKIHISGNMELGQSFSTYAEEKFEKETSKFFENIPGIEVRLKKDGPMIFTSIVANDVAKKGSKITAESDGEDVYKSFDDTFKKFISQIRKEKDKLVSKKKQGK